jgi:ribosomal-protein-alanine N-acetyltransferase
MIAEEPGKESSRHVPARPAITIRPMRGTDIEFVSRIERESFPTAWSTQAYVNELANPAAVYLVALEGETIVGYGGEWVIMDEVHITTIAVSREHRGKQIGERLFSEMLAIGIRRGATRATLEVREGNDVARRLYMKYGFVDVAQRKAYYNDNHENAAIMWLYDMTSATWRKMFRAYREALHLPPLD